MEDRRLEHMDALRGIAILAVILNHAGSLTGATGPLRWLADLGAYGVQLFFVVSAFTIFMTFDRSRDQETAPLRNFFIRRLFRIVPVYWFGILLYTAIYGLGSRGWLAGPEPEHYVWHISLMNVLHANAQSSVVPGGWSISCEVVFYLTCPIWFALVRNGRQALIACAVWIVVGTLWIRGLQHFPPIGDPRLWHLYVHRFPLNQFACFSFGILLYYMSQRGMSRLEPRANNLAVMVCTLLVVVLASRVSIPGIQRQYVYAAAGAVFAACLGARPWPLFVNRLTLFWGRVSFSAYLLHFLALRLVDGLLGENNGSAARTIAVFLAACALTAPTAYLMQRFVERPATATGKALIRRLNVPLLRPQRRA